MAEGPPRESEPRPVIQRTNGGTRERGIKWHGVCFITGARLARDRTLYRPILMCVATFRQPTDGDETTMIARLFLRSGIGQNCAASTQPAGLSKREWLHFQKFI